MDDKLNENRKKIIRNSDIITIGADPEFVLETDYKEEVAAADLYELNSTEAKLGRDGCPRPMEIRPNYAHLNRISTLIDDAEDLIKRGIAVAGNYGLRVIGGCGSSSTPIGCHLHFGFKKPPISEPDNINNKHETRIDKTLDLLDSYFTPLTNLILNDEQIFLLKTRIEHGYGKLGAVRYQPHGFEYRTPYCFLISPFFIRAFFSLASLIVYNVKNLKINNDLLTNIYSFYDKYDKNALFQSSYPKIKTTLKKLLKYNSPNPDYNSYIYSLFSLVENKKEIKIVNITENYGLKVPQKVFMIKFNLTPDLDYIIKRLKQSSYHACFLFPVNLFVYQSTAGCLGYIFSKTFPELFGEKHFETILKKADIKECSFDDSYLNSIFNFSIGISNSEIRKMWHEVRERDEISRRTETVFKFVQLLKELKEEIKRKLNV